MAPPVQCVVTGTLQSLTGGKIAQGFVIFELGNIGIGNPVGVIATSLFPLLKQTVQSAPDGSFTTLLWGNDVINPANTIYNVTYRDSIGNAVGPVQYSIVGATANLNILVAVGTTLPPVLLVGIAPIGFVIISTSINFTAVLPGNYYFVTTGAGTIIATLPTAVGIAGQTVVIKKVDAGVGTVVLTPNGAQKIDGLSTFTLSAQFQYMGLVSDGANWQIFTRN